MEAAAGTPGDPTAGSQAPYDGIAAIEPTALRPGPSLLPDVAPGTLLRPEEIKEVPEGVQAWRIPSYVQRQPKAS